MYYDDIYIYGETAFSHQGDFSYLLKQIDEAVVGGLNAVKFQVLLEPRESYTEEVCNKTDAIKYIFNEEKWIQAIHYAKDNGLDVVVLPIDLKGLVFSICNQDLIDMIEIHSINFNHKEMLDLINEKFEKKVILGVGGRTLSDIDYSMNKLSICRRIMLQGSRKKDRRKKKYK